MLVCKTNTYPQIRHLWDSGARSNEASSGVRKTQVQPSVKLPIGRMARLVFEIEAIRGDCCDAAKELLAQESVDEIELEECARIDDALLKAHSFLKAQLRTIMLSRIRRNTRARGR